MTEYEDLEDGEVVGMWETVHRNDERTRVLVLDAGFSHLVLAVDLDESGREVIAEQLVTTTRTREEATERAMDWMEENPKGIKTSGLGGLLG